MREVREVTREDQGQTSPSPVVVATQPDFNLVIYRQTKRQTVLSIYV